MWRRFLEQRGTEWPEYAYDVEIHGGPTPIVDADPTMARTWARLIAKRIDAIGRRDGRLTIFEIRQRAAWQSIGQLIGYRRMFPLDYPEEKVEAHILVTDLIDPQIAQVANAEGIQIIVVSTRAAPSELIRPIPQPHPPA